MELDDGLCCPPSCQMQRQRRKSICLLSLLNRPVFNSKVYPKSKRETMLGRQNIRAAKGTLNRTLTKLDKLWRYEIAANVKNQLSR